MSTEQDLLKLRACRSVEHALKTAWRKKDDFAARYIGLSPVIKHASGLQRNHIRGLVTALRILRAA